MLVTEKRQLMINADKWDLEEQYVPYDQKIEPLNPEMARIQFLRRFFELQSV